MDKSVDLSDLVTRKGNSDAPFRRQIDLWWSGFIIGMRMDRKADLNTIETTEVEFVSHIFAQDLWRLAVIETFAIGKEGQDILTSPQNVIRLANEYALFGVKKISTFVQGETDALQSILVDPTAFFTERLSI
mgnify:FL=1